MRNSLPGITFKYTKKIAKFVALKGVKMSNFSSEDERFMRAALAEHLCNMYQTAEENKNRKPGDPNAFVIGRDGVRQWIMERFDACMASVVEFSDIRKPFVEE